MKGLGLQTWDIEVVTVVYVDVEEAPPPRFVTVVTVVVVAVFVVSTSPSHVTFVTDTATSV